MQYETAGGLHESKKNVIEQQPTLDKDYLSRHFGEGILDVMKFRLHYGGPLPPQEHDNKRAKEKWGVRRYLSPQLQDLYAQEHVLSGIPHLMMWSGQAAESVKPES